MNKTHRFVEPLSVLTMNFQMFKLDLEKAGQVVWYSHLFKNFPEFVVVHTIKSFGIVNKAVLLPGKSHGRRSLVGCSPWGHKELDTTEQLNFSNFQICR